jgi:hypothetical protein
MNNLKLNESLPPSALVETALATIKTKKAQIILASTALVPVVQTIKSLGVPTQKQVDALTDEEVAGGLHTGGMLIHVASKFLKAYAVSFKARFAERKKAKAKFCGEYYSDFDRAAKALTGYTGQQIRNIANGTPTPKPAPHKELSAEEKEFRAAAKELQAKVDAGVAERRHEAEMRAENYTPAQKSAVAQPPCETPITIAPPVVNGDVAAQDARSLDEAIEILREMLYALPAGKLSRELTAAKKKAVAFLRPHGGLGALPPPITVTVVHAETVEAI